MLKRFALNLNYDFHETDGVRIKIARSVLDIGLQAQGLTTDGITPRVLSKDILTQGAQGWKGFQQPIAEP